MTYHEDDEDWMKDDGYAPSMDCNHEDADVDTLTGEMMCACGFRKYLTDNELRREAEIQTEMAEAYHHQMLEEERAASGAQSADPTP
jgi:hypothetical protein